MGTEIRATEQLNGLTLIGNYVFMFFIIFYCLFVYFSSLIADGIQPQTAFILFLKKYYYHFYSLLSKANKKQTMGYEKYNSWRKYVSIFENERELISYF